jgi:hypothetical protein
VVRAREGLRQNVSGVPGLQELLLKRLLDDLFQPLHQLTTEQLSKERDVTRRVHGLRIDPQLRPEPDDNLPSYLTAIRDRRL